MIILIKIKNNPYALNFVSEMLERMILPPAFAKSKDSLKKSLEAKKVFYTFYTDSIKMLRKQADTVQRSFLYGWFWFIRYRKR